MTKKARPSSRTRSFSVARHIWTPLLIPPPALS
jgi:hypothetical protein